MLHHNSNKQSKIITTKRLMSGATSDTVLPPLSAEQFVTK